MTTPTDALLASRPVVHILHENADWIPPLAAALEAEGVPYREWPLTGGSLDLTGAPPDGVFWSRFSASSHTRGNASAKEFTRATLRWLEAHGRRVVGGSGVLEFEVSKVAQHLALAGAGFDVPKTIAVFGRDGLRERARELTAPFITKHNQGGKGLGVRRFDSHDDFDAYVVGDDFEEPIDGITLLQEYLQAREPFITRAEFVGGRFLYAVRVDTSSGSFELCPAEACAVPSATTSGAAVEPVEPAPLFTRRLDIDGTHPLIVRLETFLADHGIEIAGIEFIETVDDRIVPYDVNTNTNYNPDVEADRDASGAVAVARFLGAELERRYAVTPA
ncbi:MULTISPECIES: ATP-grasp domain-containing protein [unclassified Plantibacter]|jgi:hypothetical protein|uniref:ATP-grasp domain-containing protein n=1 Tax=unclassified Plantibacter TaxID=2624265 RepID=UPI003D35101C